MKRKFSSQEVKSLQDQSKSFKQKNFSPFSAAKLETVHRCGRIRGRSFRSAALRFAGVAMHNPRQNMAMAR
jgi:hypothetical protein